MPDAASGASTDARTIDSRRHPAALSRAIAAAWQPCRWRAYAVGLVVGLLVGGVMAPIATTSLSLALRLAGVTRLEGVPWAEVTWTVTFAATVPAVVASTFTRWQPPQLRMASQAYVWLAARAAENWACVFGSEPVPGDDQGMRNRLASAPTTAETAAERFGLLIGLVELDRARAAALEMPGRTAHERYTRAAAIWLVDFVAGRTMPLDPLRPLVDAIDDRDERMEASIELAANHARIALAEGGDWQAPLARVRDQLGVAPLKPYALTVWQPTFRAVAIVTGLGAAVFWLAVATFGPH